MVMNGDIMEYLIKKVFYTKLNLKYECSIVYNGHGLAMWRYLKIVSPEPLLNKVTKVHC